MTTSNVKGYLPWPQGNNRSLSESTYSSKQIAHVS